MSSGSLLGARFPRAPWIGAAFLLLLLPACGGGGTGGTDLLGRDTALGNAILSVSPTGGSVSGGTFVTITTTSFIYGPGATVSVTFDGFAASSTQITSDTTVTCYTPAHVEGLVTVAVTVGLWSASLPAAYEYVVDDTGMGGGPGPGGGLAYGTLYAADGKSGVPGYLYLVDPATGATTRIGDLIDPVTGSGGIGYAVTGLAASPGGVLYAVEATQRNTSHASRLLQIDRGTGVGTVVGELLDASGSFVHGSIADITFVGARLVGWTETGDDAVEIDLVTAVVTPLGGTLTSFGSGLASIGPMVVFAPEGSAGRLFAVDSTTGFTAPSGTLTGSGFSGGRLNALTALHDSLADTDVLMGVDSQNTSASRSGAWPWPPGEPACELVAISLGGTGLPPRGTIDRRGLLLSSQPSIDGHGVTFPVYLPGGEAVTLRIDADTYSWTPSTGTFSAADIATDWNAELATLGLDYDPVSVAPGGQLHIEGRAPGYHEFLAVGGTFRLQQRLGMDGAATPRLRGIDALASGPPSN